MEKLIDIASYPAAFLLDVLLQDKSTKKNIIWATDTYEEEGTGFTDKVQMNASSLLQRTDFIRPRIQKSQEAQAERTRKKAEVFTPAWLCNQMNNNLDEDWFGRKNVFNIENEDHTWTIIKDRIEFPKQKKWQHYVDSRRLEITCGEAPYLVSRYDVSTGELIVPPIRRIGILDRKLRIVNENTETYEEWLKWSIRAFEASYGFEYQGDNVLMARINLLMTFMDYHEEHWERNPEDKVLQQLANKIAWNIWQMDGLKDTVPLGKPYEEYKQMTLFDMFDIENYQADEPEAIPCRIFNWRSNNSLKYMDAKEMQPMGKKLFNYVIGNPPYQEEFGGSGNNKTYGAPVYNQFIDAVYGISDKVELIHPARFLFNAGSTPKAWNKKMLEDPHFKVLQYEEDATKVFSNTDIKGGIAITYHDDAKDFGAIGIFTPFSELNEIMHKVWKNKDIIPFSTICVSSYAYHFSEKLHEENPTAKDRMSKGHLYDLKSNVIDKLPDIFLDSPQKNNGEYLKVLGRTGNQRAYKFIQRKYIQTIANTDLFKVFISAATGTGQFGETFADPLIAEPGLIATETFSSIGAFPTEQEGNNCMKYIKSKFARALLGVLKKTQHLTVENWKYVPLQDFTASSDIDWSKSISEIDCQLYRKYGLDEKEIEFIETHVKEMA